MPGSGATFRACCFVGSLTAVVACSGQSPRDALLPSTGSATSSTATLLRDRSVQITEYPVGTEVNGEGAVSPTGDLWIASTFAIVHVAPNGTANALNLPEPYCIYGSCLLATGGVAYRKIDKTIWLTDETTVGTGGGGGVTWTNLAGTVLGSQRLAFFSFGSPSIVIGSDSRAWFPWCGFGPICALGAVSESKGETDYDLDAHHGNTVANGPGGNLYVTEVSMTSASDVAEVSTQGKLLRRFPLPDGSINQTVDNGIAEGAEGALWIVENGINRIARLSPATGVVKQFPIPTASADARNIVLGADGSLWFTEFAANKVGRIANGKITEYPVPTQNAGPDGIMGPSAVGCPISLPGYLWIGEDSANAVAKLTF